MIMKKIIFTLILIATCGQFLYSQANEQIINGEFQFGNDVAIDGEWAVVGNMWDEGINPNIPQTFEDVGSVSVYKQNVNGTWEIHTVLQEDFWYNATNEVHGINYGMSVDIDGEWIVVGADYDSDQDPTIGPDGVVFVYKYDAVNDFWLFHQKLSIHDAGITPHPVNNFGFSVAVTESLIVVGDPDYGAISDETFRGAVYIYELNAGNWVFSEQILAQDGWSSGGDINAGYGDEFGYAVAVWGADRFIAGAINKGVEFDYNNRLGAAYVYQKVAGNWNQRALVHNPNWVGYQNVGYSVDIVDGMAIIGAPATNNQKGALLAATYNNNLWAWHLIPSLQRWEEGDRRGESVSVAKVDNDGNYLLAAGVPLYDGDGNQSASIGEVNLYQAQIPWDLATLHPSVFVSEHATAGDEFGNAVALDKTGSNLLVGSWMTDSDPEPGAEGAVSFFNMQAVFAGVWDGEEDDDWNNPTNWTDDNVPNGFTDVVIPAASVHMPTVDGFAQSRNLNIEQGASLTLSGEFAEMNVTGDATINGEIIIPEGALNELAQMIVGGTTFLYCEKDKQFPGGLFNGEVTINASSSSYEASLAGDAVMYDGLAFGTTRGELLVGSHTLELHGLVSGYGLGLRTSSTSNLILAGEPPIPFQIPQGVSTLNNLTVDNGEGVSHIVSGSLTINGTLTLNSGQFKVFTSGGISTLYLYNSVAGDPSLFWTDEESAVWIMGSNPGVQYPSGSSEVFGMVVNNPNQITFNNNLLVHNYLYLLTGGADANGNQVSFTATGELWSAADITIDNGLFDLNNPPRKIHVANGSNVLFDAVGAVENIELGGFPIPPMNFSPELFDQIVANQNRSLSNLTSLEIQPQKGISVQNQLIANGALVLKSDINGNSSFIDDRNSPDDVSATVENYLSAGRWHFVSPSVEQSTAAAYYIENGSDIWMKEFNETTNQWEYISSLTHPLVAGKGYAVWVDDAKTDETASYEGILNNGDKFLNLSYSGVDHGWNLIGNPFPSSLDLSTGSWSQSHTTSTVYVYDDGNYVSSNLSGDGTLTNAVIPPGQGFFVQANAANATFLLPQDARVHSDQAFYRSAASYTDALILTVTNQSKKDKTWVSFDPEASDAFDAGRDAWRLQGDAGVPQLYTRFGDRQLAINVMGALIGEKEVPLFFEAATDGSYILEVSLLESFTDTDLLLEDHFTGQFVDLSDQQTYVFDAIAGSDPHRFTLHFIKTPTGHYDLRLDHQNIEMHCHNGILNLRSTQELKGGTIQVFAVSGQLLLSTEYSQGKTIQLQLEKYLNMPVVVSLTDENVRFSKQIVVD